MSELKKYTNFEALKSDIKPDKAPSPKDNKLMAEFEAFMNLLQQEFSLKKSKATRGKQPG
jgi:hypothetical protein